MAKAARKKGPHGAAKTASAVVPLQQIEQAIYLIRGLRVMLDTDLAAFYGVPVRALNQAVKRNAARFPGDFVFQVTQTEAASLRSQIVTLDVGDSSRADAPRTPSRRGRHRKYLPHAFTEHGAIMAATVLNSERAVQVSVLVVRAFVRLRQILAEHRDLARRIEALEREFTHKTSEHEQHIRRIYEILDDLMNPPAPPKKGRIGFAG
jgi:hypothetical protein